MMTNTNGADDLVSYTAGEDGVYRTEAEHVAERARQAKIAAERAEYFRLNGAANE